MLDWPGVLYIICFTLLFLWATLGGKLGDSQIWPEKVVVRNGRSKGSVVSKPVEPMFFWKEVGTVEMRYQEATVPMKWDPNILVILLMKRNPEKQSRSVVKIS